MGAILEIAEYVMRTPLTWPVIIGGLVGLYFFIRWVLKD